MNRERPPEDLGEGAADSVIRTVAAELDRSDPPPEAVVAMAVNLYAWRNAEAELLDLLVDSAAQALPLARSEASPARVMAFGDSTRGIHFECHQADGMITLQGAVQPPGVHSVVAERIGGLDSTSSDSFGLFELGPVHGGRIRLIVRSPAGADPFTTPWFFLEPL